LFLNNTKKNKKNQNLQKEEEVEGPILRTKQHFTYKYGSTTQNRGAILKEKYKKKRET
jgi:hypothetical protein